MKSIISVAGLLLLTCSANAGEQLTMTAAQIGALGIETTTVEATAIRFTGLLPGEVAVPNAQLQVVTAPQQGLVETLLVAEGETVSRGQPMLQIQSPSLLALQSEYLEAYTRYQLAQTNYRRDKQLSDEGIIAERRLLESEARYRELGASLSRVRGLLELAGMDENALHALVARRDLSGVLVVRAPFDGVVLDQMVLAGSRVEAADPLYRIGNLNPLWLEVHVPLEQLGDTAPGQEVVIPALELSGRIVTVGRSVHGADQGVMVRAEIHEGTDMLRPGQFVQVQLAVETKRNSFRVPRASVAWVGGNSFVFLATPSGFTPVEISVAGEEAEHLIITAELAPGARVASGGIAALKAAWLEGSD